MNTIIAVSPSEICSVTENIWLSLLGLTVRRTVEPAQPDGKQRFLTGCVQITGAWEGAVMLDCSAALARRAASIMFGVDPRAAGRSEIRDALGELTNMTGGNIKSLLPAPSALSLPSVTEGLDYTVVVPGGRLLNRVGFECHGESLTVSLLQRDGGCGGGRGR